MKKFDGQDVANRPAAARRYVYRVLMNQLLADMDVAPWLNGDLSPEDRTLAQRVAGNVVRRLREKAEGK